MDNPEVTVRDERMRKLDSIVSEVKQSEEWEAVRMSILSVGIELGKTKGREEGIAEGKAEGIAETILELLEEVGPVPRALKKKIMAERDLEVLKRWCKKAACVESIEEFEQFSAAE